ncbi:class I SAM-dependent methyltransferase [Methanoculleus sp. FWC-SCC1]|uniref:Class I SAM-dependent methyltransferase n=1 Tax=Methanoculleus frigidifontis TaxID=2584085 RepID=A0ABT8MAI4_9EURY|nr:class I SAM-dependent methyltransferase [Methanoculleus sp. FWC-SCC1]MDN7024951.1 class I SAM-dependent methyltransferase [Methanoculleus sp. FWC-SCC1]
MGGSPEGFNRIAREVFAPIYPVIADRLLGWSGARDGLALDIGSGPGLLGFALARKSNLSCIALDSDPAMAAICRRNAAEEGLSTRICPVLADVHRMPLKADSIALAVSRGSVFFWGDRSCAFREIERVLRPGGVAYVGGSFGSAPLRDEIFAEMRRRNPHWDEDVQRRSGSLPHSLLFQELEKSGVAASRIREEEAGWWVEIRKC